MSYRSALVGSGALCAFVVGGCIATGTTTDSPAAVPASVDRVVDGDTFDVLYPGETDPVRVRVLGIDTPESVKPDAPVECWGPEASQWATTTLTGATVQLSVDPAQDATDRYGRQLRYVTLPDGSDYSTRAAEAGMARAYTYGQAPLTKADEIAAAETAARAAQAGLWGFCPR